jgi:hypothetical protein
MPLLAEFTLCSIRARKLPPCKICIAAVLLLLAALAQEIEP